MLASTDQDNDTTSPEKTNEIHFVNQGTFGCVYKPHIKCKNNTPISSTNKNNYISKIVKYDHYVKQEEKIGKQIISIKHYYEYFAPVIETCEVNIGILQNEQLEKCKLFKKNIQNSTTNTPLFISNKIKYVGKKTLGKYFVSLMKTPKKLLKKIPETHTHLLKGLTMLNSLSIVHYDLKENNILHNDETGTPIIIDFGLSFDTKELTENNYKKFFYVYYSNYPAWCIEIILISYIVNVKKINEWTKRVEEQDVLELKKVCDEFLKNYLFKEGFDEEALTLFKKELHEYVSIFKEKTWKNTMDILSATNQSWDNYSVSVIYFFILMDIFYHGKTKVENDWISDYVNILKKIILSPPDKRPPSEETLKMICQTKKHISKNDHEKIMYETHNVFKEEHESKKRRMYYRTMKQLEEDEIVKNKSLGMSSDIQ